MKELIITLFIVCGGFLIAYLSILIEHRNDNKCFKCGKRTKNSEFVRKMFIGGINYKCSNCGHIWRILEDY